MRYNKIIPHVAFSLFSERIIALSPSATSELEELSFILIGFSSEGFYETFVSFFSATVTTLRKGVVSLVTCVYRSGWNE